MPEYKMARIYPIDLLLGPDPKDDIPYSHICCNRVNIVPMSIVVGVLQMIYIIVSLSSMIYAMSSGAEEYKEQNPMFSNAMPYGSMPALMGLNLLWLLFLFLLCYGIKLAQPLLLLPQAVMQTAAVLTSLLLLIANIWALATRGDDVEFEGLTVTVMLMAIALLVLQLLCLVVVVRCYFYLKEQKRRMMVLPPAIAVPDSAGVAWVQETRDD